MAFRSDCAIIGACVSKGQKSERMTGMEQMRRVRTTLKDIANACGYSVNTVSRALRGDKRLSKATRSLIQETARSMDYIPNTMASSLRSGRSRMIAVIVNDLHNQHFCDLLNRMDRELRKADYNLMILCMQLDDSLAEKLIHTAISLGVDGILYFPNFGQRHYIEYMTGNDMPFVLLDRRVNDVEADTVRCDDLQGGYLAGQHLAALGHRRFLFLSGVEKSSSQMDRFNGFLQAIRENGIPEDDIIKEDRSVNTYQNMMFSKQIIDRTGHRSNVMFSTTNYHVFRSGVWAADVGLVADGIGSGTKWWFWPNAFIRECVGLLQKKLKQEILLLVVLVVFFGLMSIMFY